MGSQRRLSPRHAGLIAALALVAGCSSSGDDATAPCSTVQPGESRVELGDRWYLRHVSPAHDGTTAVPLLVDLHGYSEGAELHAGVTRWGEYGDDEGFVTVTPHGLGDPPQWDLDVDGVDVTFVDAVLDDAEKSLCIDTERVYVTGHSMGGFLVSTLACSPVAERVAAFAPVAGVRDVQPCEPSATPPALVIHGTADDTVLYGGGLLPLAADLLHLPLDGPSIPDLVTAWAERNGCTVTGDDYRCPSGHEVALHPIEGGTHEWSGGANDDIWSFFEEQALERAAD